MPQTINSAATPPTPQRFLREPPSWTGGGTFPVDVDAAATQDPVRLWWDMASTATTSEPDLAALAAMVQDARSILDLPENWDGEGSTAYARATWDRAVKFLRLSAAAAWRLYRVTAPVPFINPGPRGSIDLHWRAEHGELLVNIPADPEARATFYGDNYADVSIEGRLDPARSNVELLRWLMISHRR